jgi:Vacuolar protein sorting-associated protein 62
MRPNRAMLDRMRSPLLAAVAVCAACSASEPTPGLTDGSTGSHGSSNAATSAVDPSTTDPDPTSTATEGSGLDTSTDTGTAETGADTGTLERDPRQVLLETHAPRIWFTADEEYWPSSVEWAFPQLERFMDGEGQPWLQTVAALGSPSDTLPFFAGDLASAPIYGYWADKGGGIVDLVYFVYYPYNRGKSVLDTIWGNHVGDWEHITVRLVEGPGGGHAPSQVYLSAHDFGGAYDWGSGEVELFEGTHPVVYAAWGSHGIWAQPGDHVYMSIGETDPVFDVCITVVCTELVDRTAAGIAWDSWEHVQGMDFGAQQGLMGMPWPVWMSDDFGDPGGGDPTIPGMGPIYRWGNPEDCSVLGLPFDITDLIGVCRLEDGPTGPVSKGTWGPELQ